MKPVNVAKLGATLRRGVCPLKSSILKAGSWFSPTAYLAAKVALMATGGDAPVIMLYAPESEPVEGLREDCYDHNSQ